MSDYCVLIDSTLVDLDLFNANNLEYDILFIDEGEWSCFKKTQQDHVIVAEKVNQARYLDKGDTIGVFRKQDLLFNLFLINKVLGIVHSTGISAGKKRLSNEIKEVISEP